jgi:hypothetical protein
LQQHIQLRNALQNAGGRLHFNNIELRHRDARGKALQVEVGLTSDLYISTPHKPLPKLPFIVKVCKPVDTGAVFAKEGGTLVNQKANIRFWHTLIGIGLAEHGW